MLRQLIPALKKGARVVINDHCLREPGEEGAWDEKIMRTMDLVMLSLLNAREREEGAFRALFEEVDERFRFVGVTRRKFFLGTFFSLLIFLLSLWKTDCGAAIWLSK